MRRSHRPSSRKCRSTCRSPATSTRRPTSWCRKRSIDELAADVQAGLTDCANKTQDFTYEKAAELEASLLKVIEDAGVEVNTADKDAFIEASKPIYKQFADEVEGGQEMIDKVLGLGNSG